MRKHKAEVSLTFHSDSGMLSWFVEHNVDGGPWELWNEGTSTPSSGALDAFESFTQWLEHVMAARSLFTSHGSS